MHLYPAVSPRRLRIEVATASSGQAVSPPVRARPHPLDPPLSGGPLVDVLLEGSAYALAGVSTQRVALSVGDWRWEALVFGARTASVASRRIAITAPEPIDAPVPIAWETAFGGGLPGAPPGIRQLDREIDGAHLYPRNPFGLGYRHGEDLLAWELPQIEDPTDPLTPERFARIEEEGWVAAPLPWCLDEVHPATFPRVAMIAGMGPPLDHPTPLPEIARGFLAEPLPPADSMRLDPRFLQDAPPWGWLGSLAAEDEIVLAGCLPRGEVFTARPPARPGCDVVIDGVVSAVDLRPTRLVVRPELRDLLVVWVADVPLPRPFIPGVHRRIPIEVRVEGHEPVAYPTAPVPSRPDPRTV